MTFGEKLRAARKAKKLTQKELAFLIHAAHNSISNWENDQNKPDPDTIQNLCWALKVTPNYFFMGSNMDSFGAESAETSNLETNTNNVESTDTVSDEAKKIAKAFDKAKPKEKDLVRLTLSEYLDDEEQEYQLAAARGLGHVKIPVQDDDDLLPENDTIIDDL